MTETLSDRALAVASYPIIGVVAGLVAYGISLWSQRSAQAAVDVRPKLADVGFIDASFANHGGDWLWYNYPTVMTAITVGIVVIVSLGGWYFSQ